MLTVNRCWLVLALEAAHCAAAPTANSHVDWDKYQYPAWVAKSVPVLIARADANSLATAAALSIGAAHKTDPAKSEQTALELAARATDLAPQDAAISWLRLQLCTQATRACDVADVATTMRWVDPDNAVAWLPTLAAAQRDRDSTEIDRILVDMARANRFDIYSNRIVVLMFDALGAMRGAVPAGATASEYSRYATVNGLTIAAVLPSFAPLNDACRESATFPARHDLCLRLSKAMQRSDSIAVQLVGFSIERRLLAPDSKEARALAERRRVLEWRAAAAARFDSPLLPWTRNAHARARIAQMRAIPREEDVCIAILKKHKMALEPPEVHT